MRTLAIELKKEKRTGIIPVLLFAGLLGAAYAFANFIFRKENLLSLPIDPMDVLLTQLYGVILIMNLFGIVVAACIIFRIIRFITLRKYVDTSWCWSCWVP